MKFNKILSINKMFINGKYPKNSKTVHDLQNSLFIHKMFAYSKIGT